MKIGILWDLDGTLLDTLQDLTDATNYALAQYGLPERSLEEIRSFVGNGARQLIALSMPGEPSDPPVDAVLETYQVYYRAHSQVKTKPYDGILEVLDQLGKEYPMAIVSNKPDAAVKILCKEYFPKLYAMGERSGCPRKPAPDMLFEAMRELGIDRCVYVGDSDVDAVTAGNAGAPCVSVLWGFRDADSIRSAGGKYFCEVPAQLPERIAQAVRETYGQ